MEETTAAFTDPHRSLSPPPKPWEVGRQRQRGVGTIAAVRYFLSIATAPAVACFAMMLVTRFEQPWLSFAALGTIGAYVAPRYGVIRPLLIRQQRQEDGLCRHCGYDLTGNVSGVCPECGSVR
jgi:hypothetical protein